MPAAPDPYLIEDSDCLKNRLGLTDPGHLALAEAQLVSVQDARLVITYLPGKYDYQHLQRFHKRLFGDVYLWAGSPRSADLYKGGTAFMPVSRLTDAANSLLDPLFRDKRLLLGNKRSVVLDELTELLASLNFLHPFREGNGRTQRAFLRQLAASAGWTLNWDGLDQEANIAASRESVLGSSEPLRAILDSHLQRRSC